jgi:hypothetical protein
MLASPLWLILFAALAIGLDAVALGLVGVADACMTSATGSCSPAIWRSGMRGGSAAHRKARCLQGAKLCCSGRRHGGVLRAFQCRLLLRRRLRREHGGGGIYLARQRYLPMYLVTTLAYAAAGIAIFAVACGCSQAAACRALGYRAFDFYC